MIFQDPSVSLNPRMSIDETLGERIRFGARKGPRGALPNLLTMVDRLGLAEACSTAIRISSPADKSSAFVSPVPGYLRSLSRMSDISARCVRSGRIRRASKDTIAERDMTMIVISHHLAVVQEVCSTVYIFKDGRVEDFGPAAKSLWVSPLRFGLLAAANPPPPGDRGRFSTPLAPAPLAC